MSLEQFEILIHKHYEVSLALLEQMKRGVEIASTEDDRRDAEERHQQFLALHQQVEEKYRTFWGDLELGVTDRDIRDTTETP